MQKVVFLGDTILNEEPLGIQRYAYEIIKAIDEMSLSIPCEVIVPEAAECKLTFKNIQIVHYGTNKKGFMWRQLDYAKYVSSPEVIGIDLTLGLTMRGSDIVCLHDCIYEQYSQDFVGIKQRIKRKSYLIRAKRNVKRAKRIITVSETSKKALMDYYSIPEEKINVVYNAWQHMLGIEEDRGIIDKYELRVRDYYFSLGSSLPHKNFEWIVCMAKKNPQSTFVISGTNRLSSYAEIIGDCKLDNVIFTGYLKDGEIKALMSSCKAFLHPAFIEGFGIPPLEALSCGAKIMVSGASCLPEIYGDSAVYFDPLDYDVDLEALFESKECTVAALDKYSWEKSAQSLVNIIRELID